MVNNSDFSERLEKMMAYYNLTATGLAEELDFNRSTISHLISGRNKPSLDFVMKVLNKFPEVGLEWLVLGKGNFPYDGNSTKGKSASKTSEDRKIKPPIQPMVDPSFPDIIKKEDGKEIDKIVFFYKDGTFMKYENS